MNVAVPAAVRAAAATSPPPDAAVALGGGDVHLLDLGAVALRPEAHEARRGARRVAGHQGARAAQRGHRVLVVGEAAAPRPRPAPTGPSAPTRSRSDAVVGERHLVEVGPRRRRAVEQHPRQPLGRPAERVEAGPQALAGAPRPRSRSGGAPGRPAGCRRRARARRRVTPGVGALDAQAVVVPEGRQPRAADGRAVLPGLDDVAEPGVLTAAPGDRPGAAGRRQSSSSSSPPPARRITIWSSSIVISTGRWPAQCSA